MSRSYKKFTAYQGRDRIYKKLSNRAVRHNSRIANGGAYKKIYDIWWKFDACFYRTEKEFNRNWESEHYRERGKEYEEELYRWKRVYRNK